MYRDGETRENDGAPLMFEDLWAGEKLLTWAFRHWIVGRQTRDPRHMALVANDFTRICGDTDGRRALAGLAHFTDTLRGGAFRTIYHHQPCCPCVGEDELTVLAIFAACQSGDDGRAYEGARTLVVTRNTDRLVSAATLTAACLAAHRHHLPQRLADDLGRQPNIVPLRYSAGTPWLQ